VNCWHGKKLMIYRKSNDILLELVAKTLAVGATEMLVEYEGREERVFAFREGVGFGIASLDASSEEAQALREALYQIRRKQKIVTIEGVEYRLRVRIHQSFGEDVFRVTIKERLSRRKSQHRTTPSGRADRRQNAKAPSRGHDEVSIIGEMFDCMPFFKMLLDSGQDTMD
jgi:hypothetical protein